jgi:spore coat protein U-like protein
VFMYRGVILPNQPTPSAGSYIDSVQVDVKF